MFLVAGMEPYLSALNGKGRYRVSISEEAEAILSDLFELGLISSYKEKEDHYEINAKRKK